MSNLQIQGRLVDEYHEADPMRNILHEQQEEDQLLAISPVDGRYADRVSDLAGMVSEFGLIKYRVAVEAGWLIMLGSGFLPDVPNFSDRTNAELAAIPAKFTIADAKAIKAIEKRTNHDVKAVEYWLRDKMALDPELAGRLELAHFGCTSEDITNLAYAMMLSDVRDKVLLPNLDAVEQDLESKSQEFAAVPMLAHTHGQPASPTTLGKEFSVFTERVLEARNIFKDVNIKGKFNGASGNFSAATIAYPEVDWPEVTREFVESLGISINPVTTQIEPHDWNARYYDAVKNSNTILTDLAQDMWLYISMRYLKLKVVAGEVGSSTMPHKVNPIDFENAEGNFGTANALFEFMSRKLPISRLQRDLSDSTVLRSTGTALGHTVVGQKSILKGLGKIEPNRDQMWHDLHRDYSVLTEALQSVMRRYNVPNSYDVIKDAARGHSFDKAAFVALVDAQTAIPEEAMIALRSLLPDTYLGSAIDIAEGEY